MQKENLFLFILLLLLRLLSGLLSSFQEIFNRINNWVCEGSGCIIKSVDGEYVSNNTFRVMFLPAVHYQEVHMLN